MDLMRVFLRRRPELKQFGDLVPGDFERHPVWVSTHIIDYDEWWYDETDEETVRPWTGRLPVDPSLASFLVHARVTLADGTRLKGFLTPAESEGDLGSMQPGIFAPSGRLLHVWWGMFGPPSRRRRTPMPHWDENHPRCSRSPSRRSQGWPQGILPAKLTDSIFGRRMLYGLNCRVDRLSGVRAVRLRR